MNTEMISLRISEVCDRENLTVKGLAKRVGLSQQKMQRIHSQTSKPNIEFFAAMYQYGIEMNWLMGKKGPMYRADQAQNIQQTAKGGANVVQTGINTGHIVAEAREPGTVDGVGADSLLCQFATWWKSNKGTEDQVWLDKQIERAVPEYAAWKEGLSDGRHQNPIATGH